MALRQTERLLDELDESWDYFDSNGVPNYRYGDIARIRRRVVIASMFLFVNCAVAIAYGSFIAMCEILNNNTVRMQAQKMMLGLAVGLAFVALPAMAACVFICWASYRHKLGLLKRSVTVCRILLLFEVSIALLALTYQTTAKNDAEGLADWRGFIFRYHRSARLHLEVDSVQTTLKCCGFSGYQDWEHSAYFACSSKTAGNCAVPTSCCKGHNPSWNCSFRVRSKTSNGRQASDVINTRGCLDLLIAWTKYNLILLSFFCLYLACSEVILFSATREFLSQVLLHETRTDERLKLNPNRAGSILKNESEIAPSRNVFVTLQRNRDWKAKLVCVAFCKEVRKDAATPQETNAIDEV